MSPTNSTTDPANASASTSPPNASLSYCCADRKDPPIRLRTLPSSLGAFAAGPAASRKSNDHCDLRWGAHVIVFTQPRRPRGRSLRPHSAESRSLWRAIAPPRHGCWFVRAAVCVLSGRGARLGHRRPGRRPRSGRLLLGERDRAAEVGRDDPDRGIAIARPAPRPTRKQSRGSYRDATTGVIEMSPYAQVVAGPSPRSKRSSARTTAAR